MSEKIDFVMAWVDGNDPQWRAEKDQYSTNKTFNRAVQYREWDILKYWFRMVEKNAPWVNKIHFVTWGHLPEWLDTSHPKLNVVNHKDYIPEKYLPTFSSHTIELNFNRIPGLTDQFVYFNDDMFLTNTVKESDFFVDGKPCMSAVFTLTYNGELSDVFPHIRFNNLGLINENHKNKRQIVLHNLDKFFSYKYSFKRLLKNLYFAACPMYTGFENFHCPSAMLKSTYETLWELDYELLDATSGHKFRTKDDINQYIFSEHDIATANFHPRKTSFSRYYNVYKDIDLICDSITSGDFSMICINDSNEEFDFEAYQKRLLQAFETAYGQKSAFEK